MKVACRASNELKEFCNLGYAANCPRLPEGRVWDAIRFCVLSSRNSQILLRYVGELGHRPVGDGILEYNYFERQWTVTHPQIQVQRMAECYLQSYLEDERFPLRRERNPMSQRIE
jgi:hypothetical protein